MSKLRILPLGGCGEVGKNMTVIEYEDEIVIVDVGVMFPMNDMLGVDLIIPDWKYVLERKENVKAVLITHGHEDHIGAISYLMKEIDAPVFATPLTAGFINAKLREAHLSDVKVEEIRAGDAFAIGQFLVEPFHVTHSFPDCVGYGITTPVGLIVHTGDYKIDHTPVDGWAPDLSKLSEFAARGVLCLLADSTNSTTQGWTPSEQKVQDAFESLFDEVSGRIIIASFASLISRIQIVIDAAARTGRRVAIAGRSMKQNVNVARQMGYLHVPHNMIIDINEANNLPAGEVVVMATGSQGEPMSVLGKLARGRHPQLNVRDNDTIVLSSHIIPGNEETIYRIINNLIRMGADVRYSETSFVHVSGHASQEEMKLMLNMVRPQFFIPVHGELRQLSHHAKLAEEIGIDREQIAIIENGTPVDLDEDSMQVQERLKGGYVFIQGGLVNEIGFPMIRERETLAQSGFLIVSTKMRRNGDMVGDATVVSEGFLDLRKYPDLVEGVKDTVKDAADAFKQDWVQVHSHIEGAVRRYVYKEVGLRPSVHVIVHETA